MGCDVDEVDVDDGEKVAGGDVDDARDVDEE